MPPPSKLHLENPMSLAYLLDQVLAMLKDGRWHSEEEVSKRIQLIPRKTEAVIAFLTRFKFIERDDKRRKVRTRLSPENL